MGGLCTTIPIIQQKLMFIKLKYCRCRLTMSLTRVPVLPGEPGHHGVV